MSNKEPFIRSRVWFGNPRAKQPILRPKKKPKYDFDDDTVKMRHFRKGGGLFAISEDYCTKCGEDTTESHFFSLFVKKIKCKCKRVNGEN